MKQIAIYTPINVNYDSLFTLKGYLDKQTTKAFVWHIISWGDDIRDIIECLRSNSHFEILYDKISARGKYKVTEYMFNHTDEPYILGCPCEFTLKENAIETIIKQWQEIQEEGLNNIAEVRALCSIPSKKVEHYLLEHSPICSLDATWHKVVLKMGLSISAITSWEVAKFKECVKMSDYTLFQNKYNELSTSLFWTAIGRKYKTRYLFKQIASENREICSNRTPSNRYNSFVAYYYLLTKNITYFFYKPTYFLSMAVHLLSTIIKIIIK